MHGVMKRYAVTATFLIIIVVGFLALWTLQEDAEDQRKKDDEALAVVALATCKTANEQRMTHLEQIRAFKLTAEIIGWQHPGDTGVAQLATMADRIAVPPPVDCALVAQKVIQER